LLDERGDRELVARKWDYSDRRQRQEIHDMKTFTCLLLFAAFALAIVGTSAASEKAQRGRLRVVVFGAHCDDPETGAGGLIALLTEAGHEVVVGYATCFRGHRKVFGQPEAVVRRREATAACKIMGATPKFFDYAHEELTADQATVEAIAAWLEEVQPDIVVTHWPFDTHPNHHVVSSLVWQCYDRRGDWNLYCFEVMTDQQSLGFTPHLYLDIGRVRAIKKQASYCHKSQNLDGFWPVHEAMHRRRGAECGVEFAEAYYLVEAKKDCPLLPVEFLPKRESDDAE
jgi:LmbE family N-acetylglucosaminyl deacetylase